MLSIKEKKTAKRLFEMTCKRWPYFWACYEGFCNYLNSGIEKYSLAYRWAVLAYLAALRNTGYLTQAEGDLMDEYLKELTKDEEI